MRPMLFQTQRSESDGGHAFFPVSAVFRYVVAAICKGVAIVHHRVNRLCFTISAGRGWHGAPRARNDKTR